MNIIEIIANKTMLPSVTVMAFINTAPYRYKKYYLHKKNGGLREIAQPARELKIMQRIILDKLSSSLPVHDSAFAYVEKKSIKLNALKHKENSYFLKMDFEEFFNSIKPVDLKTTLTKNGFIDSKGDLDLIEKLFFYKKTKKSGLSLSVGAPSSPLISNAVMYNFDTEVTALCLEKNITYTRYADDLTFSCNEKGLLLEFPKQIKNILRKMKSPKLKINDKKTIFASKSVSRRVTGIVINNKNEISLGRKKKRMISSLIHKFSLGKLDADDTYKLKGHISYARHIEINFVIYMERKYGADTINSIMKKN